MEMKDLKVSEAAAADANGAPPGSGSGNARPCTSMEDYYKSLQTWVDMYRMHSCTAWNMSMMMPYVTCATQMQWQQQQMAASAGGVAATSSAGTLPNHLPGNVQQQQQVPQADANRQGGPNIIIPHIPVLEFSVPSIYRRVTAELIDFFLLFSAKLSLMLVIIDYLGINDTTGFMMRFLVEEIEDDTSLEELQQMLVFAFLYRVIVCMYETFFLCSQMNRGVGGATPGKFLMRLRVISLEQVQGMGPGRVQVTLPDSIGFTQALLRSVVKNFSMAFFFPACVTVFFNPHFRAAYEVLTKTMVVGTENWPLTQQAERRR